MLFDKSQMKTNIHNWFSNEMYQFNVGEFRQRIPIILVGVCVLFNAILALADRSSDVAFQFPEYDYKETSKNVIHRNWISCEHIIDFISE